MAVDGRVVVALGLKGVQSFVGGARRASSALLGVGTAARRADAVAAHSFGRLESGLRSLTTWGVRAGEAAAVGLGAFGVYAIKAAMDSQRVAAQTSAALRSTHHAANITSAEIGNLATRLQNLSGVDDEAIRSGANLLLTFTQIRNEAGAGNDIFSQATEIMLDMSAALGQDATRSAMQLGKALNNPVKGIAALGRVGVRFTDAQKKQIEALVKAGRVMDAQKIILRELNTEFGRSAEVQGRTFAGRLNILKARFEGVAETIGGAVLPGLTRLSNRLLSDVMPGVEQFASDVGHILGSNASWDRKLGLLWKRFDQTGLPDAIRGGIEKGITTAATNGPRLLVDAFRAAPWQGKAVLGAILIKKFGPAFALVGGRLGKLLGLGGAGLGAAKKAGAVPVYVVNKGFGKDGTGGGSPIAGWWGKMKGKVAPLARFGKLGGLGGPLGIGMAAIAGGMAADSGMSRGGWAARVTSPLGMLTGLESEAAARKRGAKMMAALGGSIRRGRASLERWAKANPFALLEWGGVAGVMAQYRTLVTDPMLAENTRLVNSFGALSPAVSAAVAQMATNISASATSIIGSIGNIASQITGATGRASGGRVRGGELTLVGERGPEIARFPAGTQIIPLRQRRHMDAPAGGGEVIELHTHVHLDGREIARSTTRQLRAQAARR